jgi:hypothetical protein
MEPISNLPQTPVTAPALVYFLKEILSNPVNIQGRNVPFENVGANRGVIALDPSKIPDKDYIAGLTDWANQGIGGVTKISAADYAQKKSQPVLKPSARPRDMLRARHPTSPALRTPPPPPPEVTLAGAAPPADADLNALGLGEEAEAPAPASAGTEPPPPFRPTTRRIGRSAKLDKSTPVAP